MVPPAPYNVQMSVCLSTLRSYILVTFQQITFKLGNCTNVKVLFPVVLMDFPLLGKKGLLLGITTEKIRQIILRFCETAHLPLP